MIRVVVLSLILAAQLFWLWQHDQPATADARITLLDQQKEIQRIDIASATTSFTLARSGQDWQISKPTNFPADRATVEGLLSTLIALAKNPPIAQTPEAQKRFAVSADHFQRRIRLTTTDGEQTTLFIGNNAALRKAFTRLDNSTLIQPANISAADVPASPGHWQNRTRLYRKADQFTQITINGHSIHRINDSWQSESATNDSTAKLLQYATTIRYSQALPPANWPQTKPNLAIQYKTARGAAIECEFHWQTDTENFLGYCSDRAQIFDIPEKQLQPLLENATPAPISER